MNSTVVPKYKTNSVIELITMNEKDETQCGIKIIILSYLMFIVWRAGFLFHLESGFVSDVRKHKHILAHKDPMGLPSLNFALHKMNSSIGCESPRGRM